MPIDQTKYVEIVKQLEEKKAVLVAVSKTKPVEDILELYELGQRDFGENYVQELVEKQQQLPKDIRWHFIGHLQTNKVKYIAPFVYLIHGVDSQKLLKEIDRQAKMRERVIDVLLQVHIAREETKFGMDEAELRELFASGIRDGSSFLNAPVRGLMGMASFSHNETEVRGEFHHLKTLFEQLKNEFIHSSMSILSMGMSSDYQWALEEGSNMVRIGSLLFGERTK